MVNSNHVGGSENGGFHSYCRSPQPTPVCSPSLAAGMSRRLPAHPNQATIVTAKDSQCAIREQDHFMPTSNVVRIMHKILPPQVKIFDKSKVAIQECIIEFRSFVTSEANDHCQQEQCKTITAQDLLWAMDKLGFDDYVETLALFLHRYCEFDGHGSLKGEYLVSKRPIVDLALGCNIIPYHLPPNFPMAHHHGYFGFPATMTKCMQADTLNGSTSKSAVTAVDSEVDLLRRRVRVISFSAKELSEECVFYIKESDYHFSIGNLG